MGELIAVLKIMPQSPEIDLDELEAAVREALPDEVAFQNADIEPVAFGLKAIMLTVRTEDDGSGRIDTLAEDVLPKIEGVESVTVAEAGRL